MKGTQALSLSGCLCAASCFINWLAAQHPSGGRLMLGVYVLLILFSGIALILDDPIARLLESRAEVIHVTLAAIVGSAIIGGLWIWLNRI